MIGYSFLCLLYAYAVLGASISYDGKIVGGEDTTIEAVPFQVSITWNNGHTCGGSIIDESWIMTAAHCLRRDVTLYRIRTGSSMRNNGGEVHEIKRIISHEQYNTTNSDFDVGLIELVHPLEFSETRQPILLPDQDYEVDDDTIAQISGWGTLQAGGSAPSQLQRASVPIVNNTNCQKPYTRPITDRMICAGFLDEGGVDSCQGDSGGPLIIGDRQIGIVSWGRSCAVAGFLGVYARVPSFRNWIIETTGISGIHY